MPFVFLLSCQTVFSQVKALRPSGKNTLIKFTENKNQWDDFIKFRAQLDGGALYVKNNSLTYGFYDKESYRSMMHDGPNLNSKHRPSGIKFTGFDVNFINSNPASIQSTNPTHDYCNFFIGNNPHKWAGNVKNYTRLLYTDLWKGINLEIIGQDNSAKYNFYLKPGANPAEIKLQYNRLEKISIHKKELIIKTTLNEMVEHEPYAYQVIDGKTIEVPCNYVLKKNTVSFSFPQGYNKEYELIIDPVLVFATSSGSVADNFGFTATYDAKGNLYSGGIAFFPGYPVVNAYDSTYNGVSTGAPDSIPDVVITKYDSTGTYLHYSTYIGGAHSSETVSSLIIDSQNDLFLFGATGSFDFPTTKGAYDTTFNGGGPAEVFTGSGTHYSWGSDIYVAKLSPGGNQLLASTFIGGSKNDGLNVNNLPSSSGGEIGPDSMQYNYGDQYRGEIQLDNSGYPVITSCTRSSNFPTKHAFDNTLDGWQDAVVFKFDPNLTQLQWSTFLGGSNNDGGYGLYIGKNNEVYTTGGTRSSNFPVTAGAYKTTYGGGDCDGYITKISQNGDSLLAATYIGTNKYDQSFFVELDKRQNVYVFGQSLGSMLVTPSTIYQNAGSHQFVSKLNNKLSTLIYETVIGNGTDSINISPTAFLVDNCENVYLAGWGGNLKTSQATFNMPLTSNAIQSSNPDGYNFYMMQLSKNCNSLLFATYYGGPTSREHVHGGTSRYDKRGIVYQSLCSGCGGNQDFPVTPGAWPSSTGGPVNGSNCNNATFKIDFSTPIVISSYMANTKGCVPLTVNFTNLCVNDSAFLWNFGGGDTTSVKNPTRTFTNPGTYTVMLIAYNSSTCNYSDTSLIYVNAYPVPNANFSYTTNKCGNIYYFKDSSSTVANHWYWNFGDGNSDTLKNPTHTYTTPGTYTITHFVSTQYGCKDSVLKVITISGFTPMSVSSGTTVCKGTSVQLNATGGVSYHWSPASSLNNANIANPIATPTATTNYTVNITQLNGVDTCVSSLHSSVSVSAYPASTLSAFAHPDTIYFGQTSQLGTLTSGGNIIWNPPYNISSVNSPSPTVWPEHTTTYSAMYTDAHGCLFPISSVTIYVLAKYCNDSTVFVPNTFTPNGDGMNDVLYARSNLVQNIHFVIADRWGQIVFETYDITKGWDGNFNNKPCNPDVFGYYITYKCNNGKDSFKKGNVTLIR